VVLVYQAGPTWVEGDGKPAPLSELSGLQRFAHTDFDLLGFGFRALGHLDGQHAVGVVGFNLVRVDRCRECERPLERAVVTLLAAEILLLDVLLQFPFTAHGQHVVLDFDFDVLFVNSRYFHFECQLLVIFRRCLQPVQTPRVSNSLQTGPMAPCQRVVNQAVHLML